MKEIIGEIFQNKVIFLLDISAVVQIEEFLSLLKIEFQIHRIFMYVSKSQAIVGVVHSVLLIFIKKYPQLRNKNDSNVRNDKIKKDSRT
ncbi:hypothetical protein LEP1GSC188_4490 [Leptospira weilii serovar Topaz str. LT2116]|uniref:Uncharacterized protein n=1 Tax=Leptospira weilii serovar Topaz str. LT2116 TaxID=1088540 RepID=M3EQF9_9LEPT|nr:hypothetical protein LEP1GSC188_4490 [Leptospira weilii serovar Topaz str. LT2116]